MSDTPSVPTVLETQPWKVEFDSRVSQFASAIRVDLKRVQEILAEYGADGDTSASLDIIDSEDGLPMSELFTMFVDSGYCKRGILRVAASHLRGNTKVGETKIEVPESGASVAGAIKELIASQRPIENWTDTELLEAYDDASPEIWKVLSQRARGRHFIVFNKDGTVNVEFSLRLLKTAKKQATATTHKVNDTVVRIFRAGEFPVSFIEESPFCPGKPLVSGYCSESDTDWNGVSLEARQICRIHIERCDKNISLTEKKRISKFAANLAQLRDELSKAALIFDELKEQESLPKLKIRSDESAPKSVDSGFMPR